MERSIYRPTPYNHIPRFLREIQKNAEVTSLQDSIHESFQHANIHVRVVGETDFLKDHSPALLVCGVHRGFERFLLMNIFRQYGRTDFKIIGKPYAMTTRLAVTLDSQMEDTMLPIVPRYMAKDRSISINRDMITKIKKGAALPDEEEIKERNEQTLHEAKSFLLQGGMVNIYPTGQVGKKMDVPWFTGIGTIVANIPIEARSEIKIINYLFDQYSGISIARSLWMVDHGFSPSAQDIVMYTGPTKDILETVGESVNDREITELLRRNYLEDFR